MSQSVLTHKQSLALAKRRTKLRSVSYYSFRARAHVGVKRRRSREDGVGRRLAGQAPYKAVCVATSPERRAGKRACPERGTHHAHAYRVATITMVSHISRFCATSHESVGCHWPGVPRLFAEPLNCLLKRFLPRELLDADASQQRPPMIVCRVRHSDKLRCSTTRNTQLVGCIRAI